MIKVVAPNVAQRVIDRAIQVMAYWWVIILKFEHL